MMKNLVIIFSITMTILSSCSSGRPSQQQKNMKTTTTLSKVQKLIGTGLLEMSTAYSIPLYRDAADSIPFDTLRFEIDKSGKTNFISQSNIAPYLLSEGNSYDDGNRNIRSGLVSVPPELKFRVINSSNKIFEVVLNEKTMEVCFINIKSYYDLNHIDENDAAVYKYESWPDYLKRVEFITKKNLVIYDKPDGNIIYENKDDKFLPFNVADVSGDWILLKKAFGREFNFDDVINYDGWTQWRSGDSLLIKITEKTYE